MAMDVILLERIEKLGQMGDVVSVKPGFARNYLLPQHKAIRATEANKKEFENKRAHLEARNLELKKEAETVSERLEGLTVMLIRSAGETGQLYGSVSGRDIAAVATESGVLIDRRQIVLDRPIKTLGMHPVRVMLHPEVTMEITANVARSEEEAEIQATGRDPSEVAEEREREEEEAEAALQAAAEFEAAADLDAEAPAAEGAEEEPNG